MLQKALLEMHRGRLVCRLLVALVLDQSVDNRFDHIGERQQNHNLHKPEERVDEGDGDARHRHIQKGKPEHGVCQIKRRRPEHNACHLDDEVDHCRALAVDIRADRRQKHRHCRADGNAHDDGQSNGKIDHARRRQRLQNTDRRRRALQHAGKERTEQDAEKRIGERGQNAQKHRLVPQRRHRRRHRRHAEHQNGKAHENIADVLLGLILGEHAKQNACNRDNARERRRGKQVHPAAASAEVRQTDDPARDAGAENGAHDDADCLAHAHHAGVDKADDHHACRRRRLNDCRHRRAEQKALEGLAGQLI